MTVTISGLIGLALVVALGIVLARLFGLVLVALGLLAQHMLALCRRWWRMSREVRHGHE